MQFCTQPGTIGIVSGNRDTQVLTRERPKKSVLNNIKPRSQCSKPNTGAAQQVDPERRG